jgi:hypothetical protein
MTAPRTTDIVKSAIDVVIVGSALLPASEPMLAQDGPVRVRHMASIDELLSYIENHDVDCAVVDQSRPTESRGLKLTLLAASRRVRHLIVLAPPAMCAGFEAMHGVHRVLRTPIAPRQIFAAVYDHAAAVLGRPSATPRAGSQPVEATPKRTAPSGSAIRNRVTRRLATVTQRITMLARRHGLALPQLPALRFLPLVSMAYKKLAMVVLGSLFALFLSYGSIIIFFLTSSDWSLPIELSSGHELVVRADRDLGEMKVRQNQVSQALNAAETAIAVAERGKSDARLRLEITKRSIELELSQQHKVLYATKEQIVRLRKIINDFRNQTGRGSYANNLDAAYANRTITKKAMEAGTLAVLETLHRMAIVANDLGMMEIEEGRINARVEFLNSLKEQLDKPEIRVLAAATPELVYLARDAISDQNVISEADQMIANQTAEASHLSDSLSVVSSSIKSLLMTPVGRAITQPVTVVFVPYENQSNYQKGVPLYRCAMMFVWCSQVGITGDLIPGETNTVHPLFGKPLRGAFVEAILDNKNSAQEEVLHAGRPPLFF